MLLFKNWCIFDLFGCNVFDLQWLLYCVFFQVIDFIVGMIDSYVMEMVREMIGCLSFF